MSKEDPFETPYDDTKEKLREPSEQQFSPPPLEQQEFGEYNEIIESEDLIKKKKRKKIWLIVIFAIVLPILLVVGIVIIIVLTAVGLIESCCTQCGSSCCDSCGESCSESCSSSCNNACQSSCDSCTCDCNNSIATMSLKETITRQLKLVKWIFTYLLGIFKF